MSLFLAESVVGLLVALYPLARIDMNAVRNPTTRVSMRDHRRVAVARNFCTEAAKAR